MLIKCGGQLRIPVILSIGRLLFGPVFFEKLKLLWSPNYKTVLMAVNVLSGHPLQGTLPNLHQLSKVCPGNHKHAPWGLVRKGATTRFATSTEVEYPAKLCAELAKLVEQALLSKGVIPAPEALSDIKHHHLAHARAVAGALVKASKLPPLVPEFKQILVTTHPKSFQATPPQWFDRPVTCVSCKQWPTCKQIPSPAKLLRLVAIRSKGGDDSIATCNDVFPGLVANNDDSKLSFEETNQSASDEPITQDHADKIEESQKVYPSASDEKITQNDADKTKVSCGVGEINGPPFWEAAWAIPWTPDEFVDKAVQAGHPRSLHGNLPPALVTALDAHIELSEEEICAKRMRCARKWTHEIVRCEGEEKLLKSKLPSNSRQILKEKRLTIWKNMLAESGYPDMGIIDDASSGFQLAGLIAPSGLFEKSFTPAIMTVSELDDSATITRSAVISRTTSSGDPYVDDKIWEKTMEERSKGWLEGPLPGDCSSLPSNVSVSRRFGVPQGYEDDGPRKIRPIDDFSESKVNSTVSCSEKVKLHTVDLVGALLCAWFSRAAASSKQRSLWSRTFDLKSAYRQLPLAESAFRHAVLSVYCPETEGPALFQLKCLPFGATASVNHFLRAAYSLWYLGCVSGLLMWTSYFDDFWCMSPPGVSSSAGAAAELIFGLTGWIYAKEGTKHVNFSHVISVLGVQIDLTHSKDGRCLFANTEKRVKELKEALAACLEEGTLSRPASLQLRGRLGFCESQIFGRIGNLAMKSLVDHAYKTPFKKLMSEQCRQDILRLMDRLDHQEPRVVEQSSATNIWYLFTDASFEPGEDGNTVAGLGAVLYDASGKPFSQFSQMLSPNQILQVQSLDRKTPIFELEVLALVLSLVLWKETLATSQVVCYLDNNGARDSAIKGYSSFDPASLFLEVLLTMEERAMICPWFARVPSKSNPSDAPSRGVILADVPLADSTMVESAMCDLLSRAYGPLP